MEHRLVSLLPLSHSLEQAVSLFYAMDVGADILYVRSRNPRVIFDSLREHRVTTMLLVPQLLDLFWSAIEREVEKQGRTAIVQPPSGRGTTPARTPPGASCSAASTRSWAAACGCSPPPARSCRRRCSRRGRTWASSSSRATAPPRPPPARCTTMDDHPLGCVGWPPKPVEMRIADDGEIQFSGPNVFKAYWNNPEATAAAFTADGWYRSGDLGQLDEKGRLHLHGRKKDIIVLPNGFNVYPEDIENALRVAGIRDSVAIETRPGRIEAVVLAPETHGAPGDPRATAAIEAAAPADVRAAIEAAVRRANATLGPNQRIAGWRLWPEADFPRTHTFKVRRDRVRAWAAIEVPLPVSEDEAAGAERRAPGRRDRQPRRSRAGPSGRGPRASGRSPSRRGAPSSRGCSFPRRSA